MFIELTHLLWNEPSELTKNNAKSCYYYLLYLYSISPNFDILKTYNIIFKINYLTIIKQNIEKRDIPKEKIITRRKYIQLMQCQFLPYFIKSMPTLSNYHKYLPLYTECTAWVLHHYNSKQTKHFSKVSQIAVTKITIYRNE